MCCRKGVKSASEKRLFFVAGCVMIRMEAHGARSKW
jgi:hypothetical protein